jgi:chromosome partitioning protein
MRVFALANNKGGVTKTTSAVNLARGLARQGKRTALLDLDAQSNTTWTVCHQLMAGQRGNIFDVMMNKRPLHEVIRETDQENLYIVRSTLAMSLAEATLINENMRERRLRNALRPYLSKFDYVIIDTPPNLGMVTTNALMACTDVIIPITLNEFALLGISILLSTIKLLRTSAEENEIDAKIPIFGVIVAMDRGTKDSKEHKKAIDALFGDLVFDPSIPLTVRIEEANNPAREGSLYDLYPNTPGALAYEAICEAIIARDEETSKNPDVYLAKTAKLLDVIPTEEQEDEE